MKRGDLAPERGAASAPARVLGPTRDVRVSRLARVVAGDALDFVDVRTISLLGLRRAV